MDEEQNNVDQDIFQKNTAKKGKSILEKRK